MKNQEIQYCPICKTSVPIIPRYPNYICNTCIETGTFTLTGKPISFRNEGIMGGFVSIVGNKIGSIHDCVIKGIHCWADEARFGGIVIQKKDK